jgi:hypothetical protein
MSLKPLHPTPSTRSISAPVTTSSNKPTPSNRPARPPDDGVPSESIPSIDPARTLSLVIFAKDYSGVLRVPFGRDLWSDVDLPPRLVRPIRILHDAWISDKRIPPAARGIRSLEKMWLVYVKYEGAEEEVSDSAIGRYIYDTRRAVRAAVLKLSERTGTTLEAPDPFKSRRNVGYQLGDYGMSIVILGGDGDAV